MIEVTSKDNVFIEVGLNCGAILFTDVAAIELIEKLTKVLKSRGKLVEVVK